MDGRSGSLVHEKHFERLQSPVCRAGPVECLLLDVHYSVQTQARIQDFLKGGGGDGHKGRG